LKRGIREVKYMANTTKLMYQNAQQKLNKTKKIIQRAQHMPTSLDEAIAYAENLASIGDVANYSTLEMHTNQLARSSRRVQKNAAPVGAFAGTKEGGN
jgi:hypothetical protein